MSHVLPSTASPTASPIEKLDFLNIAKAPSPTIVGFSLKSRQIKAKKTVPGKNIGKNNLKQNPELDRGLRYPDFLERVTQFSHNKGSW